ncbi:hypothetical protein PCANC_26256 [Puccinia coronata f. sp. avenae]|uniref:Uncharacterized protein n=1 Tax=Puccinia coronata f. sp. avenae TaxID=200324 RepID=A0A2N5S2X7_9BASI|nr:hypothetical protein PCANC_26256 [Puccinia coronata f. sp. avenae]
MLATQPDLSALLSSVPQPPSLCPSTFYLPFKLAGLKLSLSSPVASDLIGKIGPDHQLSPGYDRTVCSYPDFPYPYERTIVPSYGSGGSIIRTLIRVQLFIRVQPYPYEGTIVPLQGDSRTLMRIQPYPYTNAATNTVFTMYCVAYTARKPGLDGCI